MPLTIKQISEASHSGDDKSNFVLSGADVVNVCGVFFLSFLVNDLNCFRLIYRLRVVSILVMIN